MRRWVVGCSYADTMPWLLSTWVKAPILKNANNGKKLYIVSACLPYVNPKIFDSLKKENATILLACPEREPPLHYGKIASIIRSNNPEEITVITIDGSPHCFTLQASINEAEYILGERLDKKHFVVVNGDKLVEITPNSIRVARYLHIIDKLIENNKDFVENELLRHSLEYRRLRGNSEKL